MHWFNKFFVVLALYFPLAVAAQNLGPPGGGGGSVVDSGVVAWTPAVTASTTPGTPTYSVQVGSYEQIGHLVNAWFDIQLSGWSGTPSGNVTITGLPVTSGNTTNDFGDCTISSFNGTLSIGWITGRISPGATIITMLQVPQTGSTANNTLTAANAGTSLALIGHCKYHT